MNPLIPELIRQALDLPNGPKKLPPLLRAELLAEGDIDALFETRYHLVTAYTFCGQPENALYAFNWCLNKLDSDPERFAHSAAGLLWLYKFVLEGLPQFIDISIDQIDQSLLDYRDRLIQAGYRTGSYHYMKAQLDMTLGRLQSAAYQRDQFLKYERDKMSDCHACEISFNASMAYQFSNWEHCILIAQPILNGSSTCATVPGRSLGFLAMASYRLRDEAQAKYCADWGSKITAGNPTFLLPTSGFIETYARLGIYSEGIKLLETRISWAMESYSGPRRLMFFVSAAYLISKAIESRGDFQLNFPISVEGLKDNQASTFLRWSQAQNMALAQALNQRNLNTHWSEFVGRFTKS